MLTTVVPSGQAAVVSGIFGGRVTDKSFAIHLGSAVAVRGERALVPQFKSQACHLPSVGPQTSHLPSLNPNSTSAKTELIILI